MAVDLAEEEKHLKGLEEDLTKEAVRLFEKVNQRSDDYHELVKYMWEHQSDFDEYETVLTV